MPSISAKSVWSLPIPTLVARIELRAALANDDVSGDHPLAAEALDAEPLGVGVAAVTGRAGALFRGEKLQVEVEHSRAIVPKATQKARRH